MSQNNNNNDPPQVVPDVPIMRSMMVAPATAPSLSLARPEPLLAKPQPLALHHATTKSAVPKQPSTWDVESTITPLPSIYMLERSHTTVQAAPSVVAERIQDCLRRESIAATFHSQEALVEAETNENIKFTIRLWKKNSQQVIVEAQKVDGCCFLYCQTAKAVLRAAKGQVAPIQRQKLALPPCVPREQVTQEQIQADIRNQLEIATNLLECPRVDSHLMAVETLLHVAKATQNPSFAAHSILCGEFRSTLLSLVECSRLDRHTTPVLETSPVEQHYLALMRRHALQILAHCLQALADAHVLSTVWAQSAPDDDDWTCLVNALVQDVAACHQRPHEATHAAQCLRLLLTATPLRPAVVAALSSSSDRPAVLDQATAEGACRHQLLQAACAQLRTEL